MTDKAKEKETPGVGLDLGTMNIVSARRTKDGVIANRIRDAFLVMPRENRNMLKLGGVNFMEKGDDLLIVGDAAYDFANMFGSEVRRPLQSGLVSAGEIDALEVLAVLVKHVLGDPKIDNEVCYFSVPASPVDDPNRDVVYHQGVLQRIVEECGYRAVPANEAQAIVYSECSKEGFSGLAMSFGSGMQNVALVLNTAVGLSFSTTKSGDWIDAGAAKSVGSTQARMCAIKEKGIDLLAPRTRDEEALTVYYKNAIEHGLEHVVREFDKIRNKFMLAKAIPLVVSGGTSKATNFLPFFQKVFEARKSRFPFEISEIRSAKDPLDAVARGLLIQAVQEHD